ncbi:MAG: methyl-accepting chemotaxis protein [Treponema sp.]|nr:methyl-accepting chemotaxis protein [Treponema sp.]
MKIGYKFTLTMLALVMLVLCSVSGILLVQARNYINSFSHDRAMATAREYAKQFGGYFVSYWYIAQTTARLLEQYGNLDADARRPFMNRTLEGILESNPGVLGVWTIWEPNTLGDNDELHPGTEGTNDAGRFAPYWYRVGYRTGVRALNDFGLPGDYYEAAKRNSPGAIRDPFFMTVGGRELLVAGITATIYSGNHVVGVVGIDFDTGRMQETAANLFTFGGDGITKVFSNNGTVVGHHLHPRNIGTNILETELDMGGPYMDRLERAIRQGDEIYYTHFHPGFQERMNMFVTPIRIGATDTPWSLALVIPRRAVMAPVRGMEFNAMVIAVIVVILVVPVVIFLSRSLTKPILTVAETLKDISEGGGDLTHTIEINSSDEVGNLAHYFNLTLQKLRSDFSLFSQNASKVSTAVYDLSSSAKEVTTTANEQSASVAEIVSTMENNKNLSEQVATKTIEVAELAAQTEHLSQRGADLHGANESMMADIRKQNGKVVDEIRNLTDVLSRIGESVQFIDAIADRTKIIAFNAALEASSAGEAGLRFAVVASEIRRFADNVVESVVEIKERISELQDASRSLISEADIGSNAIDSGYNRMVEQKEVFENIVDVSQNVAVRSQQISSLSRQQELASVQVFTVLKEISAGVKQFVNATSSTSATADNLSDIARALKETLARYQTSNGGPHDGR